MATTKEKTALTVVEPKEYAILAGSDVGSLVASNLAGETISEFDLDQIKVPGGGGTRWTIPSVSGEEDAEAIEGIIVHVGKRRQYWETADPTGEPPDCFSKDMVIGKGTPGGECGNCPMNEFGSAKNGHGKACKESRAVFLVRSGDHLPIVVNVPPGSLKNLKQYLMRLPAPFFQVVTRLTLRKEKNADSITYSQVVPQMVQRLDADITPKIESYAKELQKVFG